jgi:hypothetical protein
MLIQCGILAEFSGDDKQQIIVGQSKINAAASNKMVITVGFYYSVK